jgi:hypothetical protein
MKPVSIEESMRKNNKITNMCIWVWRERAGEKEKLVGLKIETWKGYE